MDKYLDVIKSVKEEIDKIESICNDIYKFNSTDKSINGLVIKDEFEIWYKNGLIHRDNDLPAVIDNEYKINIWCKNGLVDRKNGYAICSSDEPDEYNVWMEGGVIVRNNGPAITFNGEEIDPFTKDSVESIIKLWINNNKLHRINGPAYESGYLEMWFKEGVLHRLDGHAVIDERGNICYQYIQLYEPPELCYFVEGNKMNEKDYKKYIEKYEHKLEFKYFHKWYEKIYSNINSEFVQKQINDSYDKLFISS